MIREQLSVIGSWTFSGFGLAAAANWFARETYTWSSSSPTATRSIRRSTPTSASTPKTPGKGVFDL